MLVVQGFGHSTVPASGAAGPTLAASLVALGNATESPAATTSPAPGDDSTPIAPQRPLQADSRALMKRYGVEPGDTLGRIANKFGLAATTIYWANKSTLPDPQLLRPGQTLVIPPVDGLVIVVGKNDTLESIAAKYGVAIQDIIDANYLVDATPPAGQTIVIPGAETPPLPAPKRATNSSASAGSTGWTGRLVWPLPGRKQITQRYGCTGVPSEPRYRSCAHFHDAIDIGAPAGPPGGGGGRGAGRVRGREGGGGIW